MANYSYAQLEGLWINAGGSAATAPLAAAIALAESAGNAAVTSANPDGGTNVGLWQLDTPGGGGAGYTVAQLQDPATNAQAAVAASAQGTNWASWETYVNGAYKADLSTSTTPDTSVPSPTSTATATAALASASSSTCAIGIPVVGCVLSKQQMRVFTGVLCLGAAGVIGLAAAVILAASAFQHSGASAAVSRAVPPVRAVVSAAGKAAPRRQQ